MNKNVEINRFTGCNEVANDEIFARYAVVWFLKSMAGASNGACSSLWILDVVNVIWGMAGLLVEIEETEA